MRLRRVRLEYEATLEPVPDSPCPAARGKAEWKVYEDDTRKSKVRVSGLDLPDGTLLQVIVETRLLAVLTVERGRARYRQDTERGEGVPAVESDQVLQVIHAGQVILAGRFREE
jgi:hypothetical protein